ncbi:MAG: LysR family transcriptional regulator [Lacunisphaera sp.]|nr:LysR family transcriptional regulator [Lacunisphaera sp.]
MELRHLRYFVAVAEELNFRKASERLRISPPALSRQVRDLESHLGLQLLIRNTARVRLTRGGAAFLTEARLTLAQFQQAVGVARAMATGQRGRLVVAYVDPVFMGFMPESIREFYRGYPDTEVSLAEIPLGDQIAAVKSGTIDIGFTIAENLPLPRGLHHVEIARSPLGVVRRKHAPAGGARIALAGIAQERLLCLRLKNEAVSAHGEIMQRIFSARGIPVRPIRQIEGTEAFRAQIKSGAGVSLIPRIGGLTQSPSISFEPIDDAGPDLFLGLHAVWRVGPTTPLANHFVAMMRKVGRAMNPGAKAD